LDEKTGLTPPHVCVCIKTGPGFQTSFVVVFFIFNGVFRFISIGGTIDYHLNYIFIIRHVLLLTSNVLSSSPNPSLSIGGFCK